MTAARVAGVTRSAGASQVARPSRRVRRAAILAALLVLVLVAGAGCGGSGDGGDRDGDTGGANRGGDGGGSSSATAPASGPSAPTAAELCAGVAQAVDPPTVAQADLDEASGIAASRTHPGVLWAHDDSGGAPEVFAVGEDGADRGRVTLDGVEARDWEDMARGPGADGTGDVLYLADIGDNLAQRDDVTVYRVPEPDPGAGTVTGVEALVLTYPNGPRDAEALVADPVTGDLFVLDKDLLGGPVNAYRVPAGTAPGGPTAMEPAGEVGVPAGEIVTGADIGPDGSLVAVRTYTAVYLWDRGPDQTVAQALAAEPCRAPSALERQGEAIAVHVDGRGYTTVSEGAHPAIHAARLG